MPQDFNALTMTHDLLRRHVAPGALCIDATAGRGRDTALLCRLAGPGGRVLAFDIQPEAVESTRRLLEEQKLGNCRVILDSHSNMAAYCRPDTVDCIVFNLGWLPGGNHKVFTRPDSSIAAIQAGLTLLKPGGVMTVCIYYGRDCGYGERDALLDFLPTIDPKTCTVLVHQFVNRGGDPPIPVFLFKEEG